MPSPDKDKAVRVRTGCLTCRKRRRKCDERKPECNNCKSRRLKCRYGIQLTFLKSNELCLEPDHADELRKSGPVRYRKLRFVGQLDKEAEPEDPEAQAEINSSARRVADQGDSPQISTALSVHDTDPFLASPQTSGAIDGDRYSNDEETETPFTPDFHDEIAHSHHFGDSNLQESIRQSAVGQIPLSLAAYDPGPGNILLADQLIDPVLRHDHLQEPRYDFDSLLERVPDSSNSLNLSSIDIPNKSPSFVGRENYALKYFIDEVLPWLSNCASDQTWGSDLLAAGLKYHPLLCSILALSMQQRARTHKMNFEAHLQSADIAKTAMESLNSDLYSRKPESVATRCILLTYQILGRPTREWTVLLQDELELLRNLGVHGYTPGSPGTLSWILLRFALASSLASRCPPRITVDHWNSEQSDNTNLQEIYQARSSAVEWTQYALILCTRATDLCFGKATSRTEETSSFWASLWSEVQASYEAMPPGVKPFMNTPIGVIKGISPSAFPSIIHISRVAMFGCIVHHATSIVLSNAKPRNIKANSRMRSATWQAVQICGLSLSNDISWSCDPLIIASLFHAGYLLSHDTQQAELLRHLDQLVNMLGWDWKDNMNELTEYWKTANV